MSCCGQNRANWRAYSKMPAPPAVAPQLQNPGTLYYLGESAIAIRGPVTGFSYLFSGDTGQGLAVDERDIPGLLQMDRFTL